MIFVACGVLLVSCDNDTAEPSNGTGTPAGSLTVYAAASLTDVFEEVALDLEAEAPGIEVVLNFGGSPTLVTQLEQGARADVLATADIANMQAARERGVVLDDGAQFARNRLTIVVPKSNPGGITEPADLARDGLKIVLAQPEVPVGRFARESLAKFEADPAIGAGFRDRVLANLVSQEPNVKAVVAKVQLGEADAGIVYATDVTADVAGDVTAIAIPDEYNIVAMYPIALTADAANAVGARAFIDYVLSAAGQAVLEAHGFIPIE